MFILIYLVIVTIISYSLWYSVVKKYDLSKLFIVKMSEPLFAAVISVLLPLNSKITIEHLISFLLVSIAILLSNLQIKKKDIVKEEKEHESNVS